MTKIIGIIGVTLLLLLQYRIWLADNNGWRELRALEEKIQSAKAENLELQDRNLLLIAEVLDLKEGDAAIEERARSEMGMLKHDEEFYQIIDEPEPLPDHSEK